MSLQTQIQAEFGACVEWLENATVAPRDEEVARALVAFCGREKIALMFEGNSTKIGIGAPPTQLDLQLSTRHLDQIFDHDAGNGTIEAGAGISLGALNAAVAGARQFVPLDDEGGTLGGAVACNSFGPSRLKWGTPRDLVVGLHAALSDGRHVKGGAKVVKNVAGYDLPKLFVGSFGCLGLITRVTIRLRPDDAASAFWNESFASLGELERRANSILGGAFEPTSLRAVWRGESWVLCARFDGGERAVAQQLNALPASHDLEIREASEAQWRLRAQLPLTHAASWIELARKNSACSLDWDAGLGIVSAVFAGCSVSVVGELRAAAENAGGWLRVENAPLERKTSDLVWGVPRAEVALMRALKKSYDAANVCAPGRFVGGI